MLGKLCVLLFVIGASGMFYLHDNINNKGIRYENAFENIYYTSDKFHSVDFVLKLRNVSKSLPDLKK